MTPFQHTESSVTLRRALILVFLATAATATLRWALSPTRQELREKAIKAGQLK